MLAARSTHQNFKMPHRKDAFTSGAGDPDTGTDTSGNGALSTTLEVAGRETALEDARQSRSVNPVLPHKRGRGTSAGPKRAISYRAGPGRIKTGRVCPGRVGPLPGRQGLDAVYRPPSLRGRPRAGPGRIKRHPALIGPVRAGSERDGPGFQVGPGRADTRPRSRSNHGCRPRAGPGRIGLGLGPARYHSDVPVRPGSRDSDRGSPAARGARPPPGSRDSARTVTRAMVAVTHAVGIRRLGS
jgi:hypothetical protein